jgi:prepilin-type N-terminal cleavage/methylation domain-containing protein
MNKKLYGFSLVEMAVVLVIIGLLMSGLMGPLSSQLEYQKIEITQQRLEDIKEVLLGFAAAQGFLPCPATDNQGLETCDVDGNGSPDAYEGFLPWAALGLDEARKDSWGNYFRYRVDFNFGGAKRDTVTIDNLVVTNKGATKTLTVGTPSQVIAIIFSCGRDGKPNNENDADGTFNTDSACSNEGVSNAIYVQDSYINAPETPSEHFDDVLTWLPKSIFVSRLALAGQWP